MSLNFIHRISLQVEQTPSNSEPKPCRAPSCWGGGVKAENSFFQEMFFGKKAPFPAGNQVLTGSGSSGNNQGAAAAPGAVRAELRELQGWESPRPEVSLCLPPVITPAAARPKRKMNPHTHKEAPGNPCGSFKFTISRLINLFLCFLQSVLLALPLLVPLGAERGRG